jgi:hypothetical protein
MDMVVSWSSDARRRMLRSPTLSALSFVMPAAQPVRALPQSGHDAAGSVAENGTHGASSVAGAVFRESSRLCLRPISCFRRAAGAVLESSTSFIVLTLAKCAYGQGRGGISAGGGGFFKTSQDRFNGAEPGNPERA